MNQRRTNAIPLCRLQPKLTEGVIAGRKVAVGHPVRVLPRKRRGHDGYDALVVGLRGHHGVVTAVQVTDPATGGRRALPPERIIPYTRDIAKRKAQLGRKEDK